MPALNSEPAPSCYHCGDAHDVSACPQVNHVNGGGFEYVDDNEEDARGLRNNGRIEDLRSRTV